MGAEARRGVAPDHALYGERGEATQGGSQSVAVHSPRRALGNVEQAFVLVAGNPASLTSLLARTLYSGRGVAGRGQATAASVCAAFNRVRPVDTLAPTHVAYDLVLETMVWAVLPRAPGTLAFLLAFLEATATRMAGASHTGTPAPRLRAGGRARAGPPGILTFFVSTLSSSKTTQNVF